MSANASGARINGNTCTKISLNESKNVISGWSPIAANTNGPAIATTALQSRLYVATFDMLPPSIEVMTGAAVAVGIKKQIKTPSARVRFHKKITP